MGNFLEKFSYTFSIKIQYATVFPIKNKFWQVILTFYFDLVLPFYFLKWNRFFSTFTPVLCESRHYFKYLLPQEVCTNLEIKRFPLIWYTIWMYGGFDFQSNNIEKHQLINIYSFWNCLSRNLFLNRIIIIPLFWLLLKNVRKSLKTAISQHNPLVLANQNLIIIPLW